MVTKTVPPSTRGRWRAMGQPAISNAGQSDDARLLFNWDQAKAFSTGSNTQGYWPTAVQIDIAAAPRTTGAVL